MTNTWGPPTWTLFHTLAEKVKDDCYINIAPELVTFIRRICFLLPCPDCQDHASEYWRKTRYNLTTKEGLKEFLFTFHNEVNKRKSYPIQETNILQTYTNNKLSTVYNTFVSIFLARTTSRLMIDSLHRKRLIDEFKMWLIKNSSSFNP